MEYKSYDKRIFNGLKIFKIYFNWKMPDLENSIYSLNPILFITKYVVCVYIVAFTFFYISNLPQ